MSAAIHEQLENEGVELLPERTVPSLLGGLPTGGFDTSGLASLIGNVGTASGNADQTAPIVQGLGSSPALPSF